MERRDFLKAGAFGALASGLPGMAYAQSGAGDAGFNALLDTLFYESLDLSPMGATAIGFDKGSRAALRAQVDDFTSASIVKSVEWSRSALARVKAISPATLSDTARRHRELAIWQWDQTLRSASFDLSSPQHPYALSQADGAYFLLPDFLDSQHPVETVADAETYLARLGQVARAIDQNGDYQKEPF